jgi:hypothetical protein
MEWRVCNCEDVQARAYKYETEPGVVALGYANIWFDGRMVHCGAVSHA